MILNDTAIAMAFASLAEKSRNSRYREDPVRWAEEVLGVTLWSKQKEILQSIVEHKKTAVKSCHAAAKTHTSAVAVCWWVSTRQDAMVRSTAPTSYQVHELLWEEIRKMHSKAGLEGEVNQRDEWKKPVHGVMAMVGSGKKPSDTNIHSFHGVHRPEGVFTVIDEGCFSKDTEVLTETGWKMWPDVTMDDKLLTLNTDTRETEYLVPERLIKYQYTGKMYRPAKGFADFLVTPNHEMLVWDNGLVKKEAQHCDTYEILPISQDSRKHAILSMTTVDYDDMVYCATMPRNNTLFTRRKGYTLWSGNCGVPESLFTAADAISTGAYDRVLTVGNPDDPNTPFGKIFLDVTPENENIWNRITISAFDTPNFTGEDVPEVISMNTIQKSWVDERAREWGVDSGRYKSKVLGEFPDQSNNAFFSQRGIDVAYDTEIEPTDDNPIILGVDIAGGGEDDTVIYKNQGGHVRKIAAFSQGNALFIAKRILDYAIAENADEIRIDNGGFGKGVIDIMLEDPRCEPFRIIRMMGGDPATDISAHRNKRAENYDHLRMSMELGRIDLDREDVKLREQMLAVQYEYTERGSIKLEAKADMRKRSQKSPDELDAVVYCTADLTYLDAQVLGKGTNHLDPRDYFDELPNWALIRW